MQKTFYMLITVLLLTLSCAKEKPPFKFPRNLAQGLSVYEETAMPMSAAPEFLRALSFKNAWRANYRGAGHTFTATVYEAPAEAVAFEAAQKWSSAAGQMAFHKDSYFVTVEGPNLEDASLGMLLKELESAVAAWGK